MLIVNDVNPCELKRFIEGLTPNELTYYDIQNDKISETKLFIQGALDDDKLVGIGGVAVWYRCLPHLFFMIKEPYQGKGLGGIFARGNIEYANKHNLPFLFGSAKIKNVKSIKIVIGQGYREVYSDGENFYSILIFDKKYSFVKNALQIILPIYHTPIGKLVRLLKKIKRLRL